MDKLIIESYEIISELLFDIEKAVYYFRKDNFEKALLNSGNLLGRMNTLFEVSMSSKSYLSHYIIETQNNVQMMVENIMNAQQENEYVLLADLYQLQFSSWLEGLQNLILSNEQINLNKYVLNNNIDSLKESNIKLKNLLDSYNIEQSNKNGYELEFTSSGELTLSRCMKEMKFYFHSNVSPKWEGFLLSESWYEIEKDDYYVYGLGLGYGVLELLKKSQFVRVTVLETDLDILYMALSVNDFSNYISSGRLHIVYDSNFQAIVSYLKNITNESVFVIHSPSMKNIMNVKIKELLENYFVQYNSMKNQYELLQGNFKRNVLRHDPSVEELKEVFEEKTVYIVAAGPSLDKNFIQLKEVKDGIIIATGTVFRKLINSGIKPDYFIVTDANPRVYAQIEGLEKKEIPMIYLSTANYRFAANYKGMKYIIYQNGFDSAEFFAKENGCMLFETGGSVSTTALDISLRLGCKKVVFLGLDLAYPDGYVHAEGTSRRKLATNDSLRSVNDIHGKQVQTSKSLMIYKDWIENRIKNCKSVEIIDATEGGAKINGTLVKTLQEVISQG